MNMNKLFLKLSTALVVVSIFAIGWFSSSIIADLNSSNSSNGSFLGFLSGNEPEELISPYDHIKQDQIHVYADRIVIDLKNANWAEFTDTNSMDPIFDKGANSFEITPESEEDIHIGDIISYKSAYADGLIVHRVIDIGVDEKGWYCIMKGDNLKEQDPGKIRFNQIHGVLIGIIY